NVRPTEEKSKWSTQTFVLSSIANASHLAHGENLRLRMMTFLFFLILMPPLVRPELAPTPRMDLLLPTSNTPHPLRMPETLITADAVPLTAAFNALQLVTVTEPALPPPAVPPFCVA